MLHYGVNGTKAHDDDDEEYEHANNLQKARRGTRQSNIYTIREQRRDASRYEALDHIHYQVHLYLDI